MILIYMMKIQEISVQDIDACKFNFMTEMADCYPVSDALAKSVAAVGFVSPLLLTSKNELIDGFQRFEIVKSSGLKMLPVLQVADDILIPEFLACNHFEELLDSAVKRAGFIAFLINHLKMKRSDVLDRVFPILNLGKADKILRENLKISELPLDVRLFAVEKQFSHKQLVMLTQYSADVMSFILSLKGQLHLSAASFLESIEWVMDDLRTYNIDLETFLELNFMREIITSFDPVHQKTQLFKQEMYKRRNPILNEINTELNGVLSESDVGEHIRVSWDRTLENKYVDVSFRAISGDDYRCKLEKLKQDVTQEGIGKILDAL